MVSLIMAFLLQQPAALEAWASTGVMGKLHGVEATEFHRSLRAVAVAFHEDTPTMKFKHLSSTSRLMGSTTVLGALQIVEAVVDVSGAGAGNIRRRKRGRSTRSGASSWVCRNSPTSSLRRRLR